MSGHLTRYYVVNAKLYWEDGLETLENGSLYLLAGKVYTKQQLEEASSSWGTGYNIDGAHYAKQQLQAGLSSLKEYPPSSSCIVRGRKFTKREIEELLELQPPASNVLDLAGISNALDAIGQRWEGIRELVADDEGSQITITTISGEGVDTPPAQEDEDEEADELLDKILVNLQAKMQAVKRYKKLSAEVEKLRKLLAEKEADLVECEKVVKLEAGQV